MSAAERLCTEVPEDATVAQKAHEISNIAMELQDALRALLDSGPSYLPPFNRVLYTIECLANEIEMDSRSAPVATKKPKQKARR
jgi:hypothetical protein